MIFEKPSIETIYQRIKADMEIRLKTDRKILRYSFLGITALVFAGAIHLLYGFLSKIAEQFFLLTANRDSLILYGIEYLLPINASTFSVGQIRFTGTNGTVIEAGTSLQSQNGIEFKTVTEVTISGTTVLANIQAVESGVSGNVTDPYLYLLSPIDNIESEAQVVVAPNGGEDEETTEHYRSRLMERRQSPPASGNREDYIRWAKEVAGVGRAWCLTADEYLGAGTVGVVIANENLQPVPIAVKNNVVLNIESKKPVVAYVDVNDINSVQVMFDLSISPDTTQYRSIVREKLTTLFLSESEPNGTMLLTHIENAIFSSGINDYRINDIAIDGVYIGRNNIVTAGFETAVFTSIIWSTY